eukprot:Partr_v1_DN25419_c0_g1_i2_m53734 putative Metal tolerance protein
MDDEQHELIASTPSPQPLSALSEMMKRRKSSAEISTMRNRKIRDFYARQNDHIENYEVAQQLLDRLKGNSIDEEVTLSEESIYNSNVKAAIWTSFLANIALFILKIIVTVFSGSLAVLASAVDSALDLISGSVMFITHRVMNRRDLFLYPVGKTRFENLGIIVFAAVMGSASFQIITESIRELVAGVTAPDQGIFTIISLCIVVAVKFCLYVWCKLLSKQSVSCEALAQDHFNDTMTNTVTAILVAVASRTGQHWLDPVGAIALALFIIINWIRTGHYHLTLLAGRAAEKPFVQQIIYFAANFDTRILHVDTVRAYHAGVRLIVECDVILAPETTLRTSHDIGEALQQGIEMFPKVERAFVHCDYEYDHAPLGEHK